MSNVKSIATFKKVAFRVVAEGKQYDVEIEPTKQGTDMLDEIITVMKNVKTSGVYLPLIGTTTENQEKYLGTNGNLFADKCRFANITILNSKEGSTMNQTTNTDVKMTAEEWTAKLMENAAQFVKDNGGEQAKRIMNNSTEETAAEDLASAVGWAGYESGKKDEAKGILATLNPLVSEAKKQGGRFFRWLGQMALIVWRKVSAAVVGLGVFSFHTVGILFNHTLAAGKEIGECFKTDVIDRVRQA